MPLASFSPAMQILPLQWDDCHRRRAAFLRHQRSTGALCASVALMDEPLLQSPTVKLLCVHLAEEARRSIWNHRPLHTYCARLPRWIHERLVVLP
jgi:hypothetical protein